VILDRISGQANPQTRGKAVRVVAELMVALGESDTAIA